MRMPAFTIAMSSSCRCACLNSLTYSCSRVQGTLTRSRISCGFRSTRLYPRKKSSAKICAQSLLLACCGLQLSRPGCQANQLAMQSGLVHREGICQRM